MAVSSPEKGRQSVSSVGRLLLVANCTLVPLCSILSEDVRSQMCQSGALQRMFRNLLHSIVPIDGRATRAMASLEVPKRP